MFGFIRHQINYFVLRVLLIIRSFAILIVLVNILIPIPVQLVRLISCPIGFVLNYDSA